MNALDIVNKAIELGYDKCGIIPVERMYGYEEKLEERIERFPQTKETQEAFRRFAHLKDNYHWASSVVICSFWYGKYCIPDELQGRIAKYYLTDGRRNTESQGYKTSIAFETYLKNCGFQLATDRDFGITSLRWAAMQAGIGIIRKNNFFYTEKGSYQYLEAFLIDVPLKHIAENSVRPCAGNCRLCMEACPTNSLESPYMMCRNTCVSCLTTWSGWDLRREPLQNKFGKWIYGCDACQDVCPYNRNAWANDEPFPELNQLNDHLTDSDIILADYEWLENTLQPKLWYIPKEKVWRYKTNELNAMLNDYKEEYLPVIEKARGDKHKEVREMAKWVLAKVEE